MQLKVCCGGLHGVQRQRQPLRRRQARLRVPGHRLGKTHFGDTQNKENIKLTGNLSGDNFYQK